MTIEYKKLSDLNKGEWSGITDYTVGDIVSLNGSSYVCVANTTNNTPPNATYWALLSSKGETGSQGAAGEEVELQVSGGYIQWKFTSDVDWTNLIAVSTLKGDKGDKGDTGNTGAAGSNGTNGTNGTDGTDGADGREIELQKSATHIQWRFVGDVSWTNLVALSDITGPTGATGATGAAGTNGTNGTNGTDGADGTDGKTVLNGTVAPTTEGVDGDFYINTTTDEIYGPKTSGAWGSPTSIVGPQGEQGPAGSGTGDVLGPATNTADYLPQWNGANSKTLKNGVAIPAGGLAGVTALGDKVDKVTGKGLSTEDYTSDEKTKLSGIASGANVGVVPNGAITGATKTKITYDVKGLITAGADATQDDIGDGTTYKQYSATEKTKLAGIASGANVGVVPNGAITGATKTKITYDTKGLVTAGANATQDDIGDGTTNKQYSATEKTKLSGIETSADVTDAGNVGSSINGATAKTTMVDADKLAIIDTEASNVLKTLSWAYVKSILKTYFDSLYSVIGLTKYSNLNAPQGFLINGKIVPSVASNNLTVAIKGLDGNDPSASNPVYCRIGDTVRSITAALSVTKNAATNWCNAGSTELATKEIDYFVYLGYNATDGVVIGFSRIPYATLYSDFSATTTNEKYAGISIITNAAAGDTYENIGRFAATLSAGAGYTWSVPTFTTANLIQRPIYETRKLDWTPVGGTYGSQTFSVTTIGISKYQIIGKNVKIDLWLEGTTGGTAAAGVIVTLPLSTVSVYLVFSTWSIDGAITPTLSQTNPTTSINFVKTSNWGTGTGKDVAANITYSMV